MRKLLPYILLLFTACNSYKQHILLQTKDERLPKKFAQAAAGIERIEKNYVIQQNDFIEVRLYSNKGENLIDFNIPKPGAVAGAANAQGQTQTPPRFMVEDDGSVRLPQVGTIRLAGYQLRQADSLLEAAYNNFYVDPFVNVRFVSKRVVVLGATTNQVVPLTNENMNLFEVLALCGGIGANGKAQNIRLVRGDLHNPEVHLINLSTIEGMSKANLIVQPNDIIYIEPIRRPLRETAADISPILSLVGTLVSVVSLLIFVSNQNK
jgi:polysaccharide biosynthesis/export protein